MLKQGSLVVVVCGVQLSPALFLAGGATVTATVTITMIVVQMFQLPLATSTVLVVSFACTT